MDHLLEILSLQYFCEILAGRNEVANVSFFFFLNAPAPTEIYTLPLHDALPILQRSRALRPSRARRGRDLARRGPLRPRRPRPGREVRPARGRQRLLPQRQRAPPRPQPHPVQDRKSTRLNSSHSQISYAVFCL